MWCDARRHWVRWQLDFGADRVRFFVPRESLKMHAKIVVVDRASVFLGSSNLTNGAFAGPAAAVR